VDAFVKLYQMKGGYEPCDSGDHEEGYEKLALYVNEGNEFSHVAREKRNGIWTSKLGIHDDIEHLSASVLEADYGKIERFLRRLIPNAQK
jgi:hypothetical protein